jgi:hypothetical protein
MHAFESRFAADYPICVHEVLLKFGGMTIGIDGRAIRVGSIVEYEYIFPDLLERVVTTRLYLIGETNILCDDALGVMMDEAGNVYVDGSTSDDPPNDFCVGKVSSNFACFLNAMFSDESGILEKTEWKYYSALNEKPNGGEQGGRVMSHTQMNSGMHEELERQQTAELGPIQTQFLLPGIHERKHCGFVNWPLKLRT